VRRKFRFRFPCSSVIIRFIRVPLRMQTEKSSVISSHRRWVVIGDHLEAITVPPDCMHVASLKEHIYKACLNLQKYSIEEVALSAVSADGPVLDAARLLADVPAGLEPSDPLYVCIVPSILGTLLCGILACAPH
jgi:hypothetical protein